MAQAPRAANGDDFVRHIVHDPKNVPDVTLLYGYPGASSEEGHERLYLSPDLSAYVEVPNDSILHRAESPRDQDPHGGFTLWVKKDAALKYKTSPAQEAAQAAMAWYFAGALQGGGAQAAPQAQAAQPQAPQTLVNAFCPPITLIEPCQVTANFRCLTHHATCGVTCVATCAQHATCGVTCAATCAATCPPHVNCGATCVATCAATCAATCPPHATCGATCVATCHYTCAPVCTHVTPCRPTLNEPQCPFPTEVCTHVGAQCTHVVNCRPPQQAAAEAAVAGVGAQCVGHTIRLSVQVACSIACSFACPTRHVTCGFTCAPECWVTRELPQCSIVCPTRVTCNFEACPIASAPACPQQSLGCPEQSFGCGFGGGPGGGPGAVEQAQFCIAGSVRPPQLTVICTIGAACQSVACPSWQYTCGGCPPRTPACPW